MDFEILNAIFLMNYIYILLYFAKNLKTYIYYVSSLLLALMFSLIPLVTTFPYAFHFTIFNAIIFIFVTILPGIFTKLIFRNLRENFSKKLYFYSVLRYLITRFPAHKSECYILKSIYLLHCKKLNECIDFTKTEIPNISQNFRPFLYSSLLAAHSYKGEYSKAIEIFAANLSSIDIPLTTLEKMLTVYCETGNFEEATNCLIRIESLPNKMKIKEKLWEMRCLLYAYIGNKNELIKWKANLSEHMYYYVNGIIAWKKGNNELAKNSFLKAKKCNSDSLFEMRLKQQLSKLENNVKASNNIVSKSSLDQLSQKIEQEMTTSESKNNSLNPFEIVNAFPYVTACLIFINMCVFFVTEAFGGSTSSLVLLKMGGNNYQFVSYQGEYWRFITSTFLHFGYIHLILNMAGLYFLGKIIEGFYGKKLFIIIYFLSGFFASFVSFLFSGQGQTLASVGASGAICGLIGINIYYFKFCSKINISIRKHYLFSFYFTIAAMLVMGAFFPVDNAAHFTGIIVGYILGYIFQKISLKNNFIQRMQIIIVSIFVMLSLLSFWPVYKYFNVQPYNCFETKNYPFGKINLKLPFTWKLHNKEETKSYKKYEFFDPYSFNKYSFTPAFILALETSEYSLRSFLQRNLDRVKKLPNFSKSLVEKIDLNGKTWEYFHIEYTEKFKNKTISLKEDNYIYSANGQFYLIQFIFESRAYKKYANMRNTILMGNN